MKEDIKLYSPMKPIPLAKELKAEMKKRKKRKDHHVFGGGTERKMFLTYRRPGFKNGGEPYLKAKMREHDGGTLIEGTMRQGKAMPFFLFWNGFVGLFFLFSLFLWFVDDAPIFFNLIFSGIPAVMLAIGLTAAYKTRNDPPEDPGTPQNILDFLAETVDARPL
ncbi:hypothetical protein [Sphingorhabdus sp. EL138]|uniref:hypothetical protein n=1 Tax=Sphingorhabdus sp. EL138 TaxID=2073156 RepID=UPI000D690680|nr:hypothetical protein [Sphingorhabdus sp. EL138]